MPVEEDFIQSAPPPRQQTIENQGAADEAKGSGRSLSSVLTPVIIIAAMMVAVASGFYVTQVIRAPKVKDTPVVTKPKPPKPSYIKLEPEFTVNLNSNGQYLETVLVLKADSSKVNSELDKKMPEVRDKILSILASQNYSNLLSQAGKQGLKAQIQAGVNSLITKGKIIDVLYTSFIMQ